MSQTSDAPTHQAIVIGAGFAGVTAARELSTAGLRPLLLEAADRVGGRARTETFAGKRIELGAAWFSPHQPRVRQELERYGIALVPQGVMPEHAVFPTDEGVGPIDPAEAFGHYGQLLTKYFAGSRELFPEPEEPLLGGARLREADALSMRDHLDRLGLSTRDERWLSNITGTYSGGDSARGAYTGLAQWWELPGGTVDGWNTLIGMSPETGMSGLLEAMVGDADAELRLGTRVTAVDDDGGLVRVTTSGGEVFSAPVVVVAVPTSAWETIRFGNGLPDVHVSAAASKLSVPASAKFWLRAGGGVGAISAHAPEGYPISSLFTYYELDDGDQLLIGFSQDASFDVRDRDRLVEAVRLFGDIEVLDVRAHDWGRDEFTRGGWSFRRPGQLFEHLPSILQPHGRLTFANDGLVEGWVGFVEGAIESGERAARQAVEFAA
ncbi:MULTISPECIES: flavin monoamine oxidase family protein [Saccharothrix]|uniref:flavin monoamine oxidase family protein n=1 Tax=Saccharothrix TaxID=2071 RepID=UPI00093D0373|nr:NAD(P)/FAD-dependent oxidoreductase [Saccharothrix sp. CB00851]